jgi:hypothetical protein
MTAWFAAVYERCWHFSDTLLYRTSALHPTLIRTRSLRSSRIEQVETDSWNNEQVNGGNVRRVVAEEVRHPWLGGHVL